jgi:hypothetical protein
MMTKRNYLKLVEEEEKGAYFFGWKKPSFYSSNCEVVEFVWILHSDKLRMNVPLEFFFSLT